MICAVCNQQVQRIVAGYGLCPSHATSLSHCLVLQVETPEQWFCNWKRAYDAGRGVHF